jgi:hypothetical protein
MNMPQMQSVRVRVLRFAARGGALAWLVAAFAACPGTLADEPAYIKAVQNNGGGGTTTPSSGTTGASASSCDAPNTIFAAMAPAGKCASIGCHDGTTTAENLNLTPSSGLAATLLNVASQEVPTDFLIDSASPSQSFIYLKLFNNPPGGMYQMPWTSTNPSGDPLTATEQQCVLGWIESVAASAPAAGTGDAGSDDDAGQGQPAPPAGDDAGAGTAAGDDAGNNNTPPPSSSSSSSTPMSGASSSTTAPPATEAGGAAISFATVYSTIISPKCLTCHGATAKGGLNMATEMTAYNTLKMGTSSATDEVGCNESYVTPGDAMTSLLYQKVAGAPLLTAACGSQMPKNGPPYLTTAQQTMIEDWINDGAMP